MGSAFRSSIEIVNDYFNIAIDAKLDKARLHRCDEFRLAPRTVVFLLASALFVELGSAVLIEKYRKKEE